MSIAILYIKEEYGWTHTTSGLVLSSFYYGYIGSQILGGYLSDRYGRAKFAFSIAAFLWSLFTLLTPVAVTLSLPTLIICRICLGLGEGKYEIYSF
jgi:MFS transporter, ACS family, solute carrier family 17 (sodium-dependent inorganic phosphate cotransporter), other